MCSHREPAYRDGGARMPVPLPALRSARRTQCILLPLYPQMSVQDQETVVASLRRAAARAASALVRRKSVP